MTTHKGNFDGTFAITFFNGRPALLSRVLALTMVALSGTLPPAPAMSTELPTPAQMNPYSVHRAGERHLDQHASEPAKVELRAPTTAGPQKINSVPSEAAARIYLSQALASLARAEQLTQQTTQYGEIGTFDVGRFLEELRTISAGLQRFLAPESPAPGPHLPVEITGQYLYDALSRQSPRRAPSRSPHQELRP